MNELKQGLKNAGFEIDGNVARKTNRVTETTFRVVINDKSVSIANKGFSVTNNIKFKDLEELNKICYCYLLKDLNFEAKKYSWEECFKRDKGYYVDRDSTIEEVKAMVSINIEDKQNVVPTELNALSIQATTQLMQICARINEDFESEGGVYNYYPVLQGDGIISQELQVIKLNQFRMNSQGAVDALISTNTPLLLQYFEKQSK